MNMESGIDRIIIKDEHTHVISETFFDKIRREKLVSFSYQYDSDGKLIKEIQYDRDGKRIELLYSYDEKSNSSNIRETEYHAGEIIFSGSTQYFYDDQNRKIKEISTYPKIKYITEYFYDANGNMTVSACTDSFGDQEKHKYEYDAKGNVLQEKIYKPDENIHYTVCYAYNEAGQLPVKKVCSGKDIYIETAYFYDAKGFTIQRTDRYLSNKNEKLYYYVEKNFINDENGRVIISTGKSTDFNKTAYFYNEAGRLVAADHFSEKDGKCFLERFVHFGLKGDYSRFEYEYDAHGNLIQEDFQ